LNKEVRYRFECVNWGFDRDGHGQYKNAPAVKVVSRELENVRVNVNQFHTDVTVQNNYIKRQLARDLTVHFAT
jgi:hypothetical protein